MSATGGSGNRDEAVELFNEARTTDRNDRLQCLAHVQELVLHKEPALLEEFVPAFLQLEQDKLAVVRKTLVGFLDDVIKQFPQYLPQAIPALIRLCDDSSPLVLKRLVLAATSSIFRQGLTLITSPHSPLTPTEKATLWSHLKQLRAALSAQLRKQPGHEGVRAPTAKLLETLCLAFLVTDPGAASAAPPALFNAALADAGLQAELAEEAQACLTLLIEALQPGAVATATAVVVVSALASVVRARQACRERGVDALVSFAKSVAAAPLSASQATSLQHTLKASFAALLKQKVLEGAAQEKVRERLANIGAHDQFEQLRRHSESASKRAAREEEEEESANNAANSTSSAATSADGGDGTAKRARREPNVPDAYSPATYESIDEISLHPEEGDQVPAPVQGMPSYSDVAACGPELLAELVLQLLSAAQIPMLDLTLTSTSAFSSLLSRLSVIAAPAAAPAPTPAPRAAPIAQAAYRDPRRDPRLRADAASDANASASAPPPDAASLVAQQLAAALAAGHTLLQPVALPVHSPAPVRQPMTLLPPTPLAAEHSAALSKRVFDRLLSSEASARAAGKLHERAVLIARLATRRPVDDPIIQSLLDHVAADLTHRIDLAHVWLTHEARAHGDRYATLCARFVQKAVAAQGPKDRLLVRLCADLPAVPLSVLATLSSLVSDPERTAVIVATLREVLLLHPPSRQAALELLLNAALHADEAVRGAAVRVLAAQLYLATVKPKAAKKIAGAGEEDKEKDKEAEREVELERVAVRASPFLSVRIEEFALAALTEALSAPDSAASSAATADVIMTDKTDANRTEDDTKSNKAASATAPAPAPAATGGDAKGASATTTGVDSSAGATAAPALTEEEEAVRRRVVLFFALAPRKGELLSTLVPLYGRSKAATQVLRRLVPGVVRALPPNAPSLLALLADPPKRSHPLVWQVMHTATESALASAELRAAAHSLFKRFDDPRFMISALSALSKEQCIALLPKFVFFYDTDEETKKDADPKVVLPAAFTRMLTPVGTHAPPLTPAELLIALHIAALPAAKDGAPNPLKQVADAILLCLEMKALFKQEVLAVVLQQLVDVTPIPRFLMFTVIQTAQRFPTLVSSGFVISILSHLIRHRVWQDATLWQGVIRCCKLVAPRSFSVLLQMPEAQLADVLQKAPELREPLYKFASTNVKSVPKPLQKLLGLDAESQQARRRTQV